MRIHENNSQQISLHKKNFLETPFNSIVFLTYYEFLKVNKLMGHLVHSVPAVDRHWAKSGHNN